jgi:hypothetical protein
MSIPNRVRYVYQEENYENRIGQNKSPNWILGKQMYSYCWLYDQFCVASYQILLCPDTALWRCLYAASDIIICPSKQASWDFWCECWRRDKCFVFRAGNAAGTWQIQLGKGTRRKTFSRIIQCGAALMDGCYHKVEALLCEVFSKRMISCFSWKAIVKVSDAARIFGGKCIAPQKQLNTNLMTTACKNAKEKYPKVSSCTSPCQMDAISK